MKLWPSLHKSFGLGTWLPLARLITLSGLLSLAGICPFTGCGRVIGLWLRTFLNSLLGCFLLCIESFIWDLISIHLAESSTQAFDEWWRYSWWSICRTSKAIFPCTSLFLEISGQTFEPFTPSNFVIIHYYNISGRGFLSFPWRCFLWRCDRFLFWVVTCYLNRGVLYWETELNSIWIMQSRWNTFLDLGCQKLLVHSKCVGDKRREVKKSAHSRGMLALGRLRIWLSKCLAQILKVFAVGFLWKKAL